MPAIDIIFTDVSSRISFGASQLVSDDEQICIWNDNERSQRVQRESSNRKDKFTTQRPKPPQIDGPTNCVLPTNRNQRLPGTGMRPLPRTRIAGCRATPTDDSTEGVRWPWTGPHTRTPDDRTFCTETSSRRFRASHSGPSTSTRSHCPSTRDLWCRSRNGKHLVAQRNAMQNAHHNGFNRFDVR